MSDDADDPEISRLSPFFYPTSQSTAPDPASTAGRLTDYLKANPLAAALLATHLPTFLLRIATTHPAHTDHPPNNWDSSRPDATFDEMFHVAFREDVNDAIRGPIELTERNLYIAASLLGGRARSIGMFNSPETAGSLAEGLGFPGKVICDYEGQKAEIAAIGACLQLLGGASLLLQSQPERFARDKILPALDRLQLEFSKIEALIKFTKFHLQKEPLVDLTSEEGLKAAGWRMPGDVLGQYPVFHASGN